MKKLLLIAALAAMPAWAQDKPAAAAPAAAPAPAATPAPAAPATSAAPAAEKAQHAKSAHKPNPKRSEDARHCLDEKSNTEIIKCSEAYL
jgi:hypothetical protein